jgi:putative flippase GtrA
MSTSLLNITPGELVKKYPFIRQFVPFIIIGLINTVIDFSILNIESYLTGITEGSYMFLLNAVSFSVATTNSYFMNKKWSFQDVSSKGTGKKFSQFLLISVIGMLINSSIVYTITTFVSPVLGLSSSLWMNLAKAGATGISLIWNFLGYKFLVFKK